MNALLCAFTENVLFFKKRLFAYVCTKLCEEEKGTTFRTETAFVFLPSNAYIIIPFTKRTKYVKKSVLLRSNLPN